jgi:hypothetical protein
VLVFDGGGDPWEEQLALATITPPLATMRPAKISIFIFELLLVEASTASECSSRLIVRSARAMNIYRSQVGIPK